MHTARVTATIRTAASIRARRRPRRTGGDQSKASVNTAPIPAATSGSQANSAASSMMNAIAPRDGPSLHPDHGPDIKTRLANQPCNSAANASGTFSRYFIPVSVSRVADVTSRPKFAASYRRRRAAVVN